MIVFLSILAVLFFAASFGGSAYAESVTTAYYPPVSALNEADKMVGGGEWRAVNDGQKGFLPLYKEAKGDLPLIPEMQSIASKSIEAVNEFLRKHGFSIQLRPLPGDDNFATASVADIGVKWPHEGEKCILLSAVDGKKYPAVRLAVTDGIMFYKVEGFASPVVRIETQEGDIVYMTIPREPIQDRRGLEGIIARYYGAEPVAMTKGFEGLLFPMVELDLETDLSWLVGLNKTGADGRPAIIREALQQDKLSMDEKGARIQMAAAVSGSRGGPVYFAIDKPFVVWFERLGLSFTLFGAYVDHESWKDPQHRSDWRSW